MEKFCVFCGREPQEKNKEHVIPAWLIARTGDPKRIAHFGLDLNKTPPALREFSFDAFTFPACRSCNSRFAALETAVKPIVESVIRGGDVSRDEFVTLLDWFDKIRVGLWLGYLYLDKNPQEITPNFHIEARIRGSDRSIAVFHVEDRSDGINFFGPESLCFQNSPTCFALLINQWCFLNIVAASTISRRLGFPYIQPIGFRSDGRLQGTFALGAKRMMRPVLRGLVFPNSTALHQPIYSGDPNDVHAAEAFRDEWVRTRCIDHGKGVGSMFIEKNEQVRLYPYEASADWVPKSSWSLREIYAQIQPFVFRYLEKDLERAASLAPNSLKRGLLHKLAMYRRVDRAIIDMNRKSLHSRLLSSGASTTGVND